MLKEFPFNTSSQSVLLTSSISTENEHVTTEGPFNSSNTADSLISLASFLVIDNIIVCWVRPALYVFGSPLNVLCLIVFFRQGLRDRMNFSLFSLSLVDFLFTTALFAVSPYCFVSEETNPDLKESLQWHAKKHLANFLFGFSYSSGCLTAIIAVERCLCVLFPLKAATLVKTKTMVFLIVGTVMTVNLLCLVYALRHQVTPVTHIPTGRTRLVWTDTELYVRHKSLFHAVDSIILPGMTLLNFLVVAIATVVTVVTLTQAMKWRQNITSNTAGDKRQITLVKMLVTVSSIYITCSTPNVALAFARLFVSGFSTNGRYRNIFNASHATGLIIMMLNSSVNFFVYVTQSSRFRRELLLLLQNYETICHFQHDH